MISMLEIVTFQRLLAKSWHRARIYAEGQNETSELTKEAEMARRISAEGQNEAGELTKEAEMARRIYAVSHSGLQIIPLLPEHVHAAVTEMLDDQFDAAISVACATKYLRRPFVIATLGWNYDDWRSRIPVFKASDAGSNLAIVEQASVGSSVPESARVKPSIESEYARIMAEHGRSIPAKTAVASTTGVDARKKERSKAKGADQAPIHSQLWAPYVPNRF
jgi:hypothetical protein